MTPGGPIDDWPTSASTIHVLKPLVTCLFNRYVVNVVLPESISPTTRAIPSRLRLSQSLGIVLPSTYLTEPPPLTDNVHEPPANMGNTLNLSTFREPLTGQPSTSHCPFTTVTVAGPSTIKVPLLKLKVNEPTEDNPYTCLSALLQDNREKVKTTEILNQ